MNLRLQQRGFRGLGASDPAVVNLQNAIWDYVDNWKVPVVDFSSEAGTLGPYTLAALSACLGDASYRLPYAKTDTGVTYAQLAGLTAAQVAANLQALADILAALMVTSVALPGVPPTPAQVATQTIIPVAVTGVAPAKPLWPWILGGATAVGLLGGAILLARSSRRAALAGAGDAAGGGCVTASSGRVYRGLGEVTKRDFDAIAKSLCRHGGTDALAEDLAAYFRTQNPRFSTEKFLTANKRCV